MNDTPEHKDQRLSRIYREGAWPEPSRQIDQAILAASRRAAREQKSFARRWAPSFAIAATVVLTSTLVLKVFREQPDAVSPALPEKVQAPGAKQPAAAEPVAASSKPAPARQVTAPPSGFSSTMDAGETERLDQLQRDLALRRSPPPNESPTPPPNSAPAEKAAAALKKEAPEANRAGDALLQRRPDTTQVLRARESAPPAREQRPANAPVSVFGAPPPSAAPASPPAPAAAPVPAATATPGAVTSALSAAPKAAERSPQAWVEDIRKLMAAGRSEEAGAELAEFRKRYPDYVLPEDLR